MSTSIEPSANLATAAPPGRELWPDLIRVGALLAVIVVHVAAVPVTRFGELAIGAWWWANAYDSLARPCIPLFVMLSGALLLTPRTWDPRSFARRRAAKVLIPFLAWSAIYAGWNFVVHDQPTSAERFVRHLAGGMADPVRTHLWYLPLILSLYLLVPIVRIYTTNASLRNQSYFAALWLFATGMVAPLEAVVGIQFGYYLGPVAGFIGYFVLGATIRTYAPGQLPAPWPAIAAVAFVASYAVTVVGTHALTAPGSGELDETFYSNLSGNVIVMSVSAFVLLRHLGSRLHECSAAYPRTVRFLEAASAASFGAYLIHMVVLDALASGAFGFALSPMSAPTALVVPVLALATFAGSLAVAALMRKTGLLRWLVP